MMNFKSAPFIDPAAIEQMKSTYALPSPSAAGKKKTYTITQEWLDRHDEQIRKDTLNRKQNELKSYARKILDEDFESRQKLLAGSEGEVLAKVFALVVAAPVRVLWRDFGWTSIGGDNRKAQNMRLVRFANAIQEELDNILTNEMLDIRKYATEVYEETGIMFAVDDEEEGDKS